jgi:hypothetical protein
LSHVLSAASSFWHRGSAAASSTNLEVARQHRIDSPPLTDGERVLRRFRPAGQDLVGSDHALYQRGADGRWARFAWADIAVVGWSRVEQAVVLRLWSTWTTGAEIRIAGDAMLAAFVEDRVAAVRVLERHVELEPGVVGTVIAIRDRDDVVSWQLLLAARDPLTPELREIGERVIAEIRGIAGC